MTLQQVVFAFSGVVPTHPVLRPVLDGSGTFSLACMQYPTSNWLVIAAKHKLSERRKSEIRHRARVGRYIENLEQKNAALTEVCATLAGSNRCLHENPPPPNIAW
jgi:hypothetical protein